MSHVGLQDAGGDGTDHIMMGEGGDGLTGADAQTNPTQLPTLLEKSAKPLAEKNAKSLPFWVGKNVDNTPASQTGGQHVEALELRRDAQWVREKAKASGAAGGGALSRQDQQKSAVSTKQLSVKYYMSVIDTVEMEENSGQEEDAINWQIVFDLEDVQVGRLAKMCKVAKRTFGHRCNRPQAWPLGERKEGGFLLKFGWLPRPPR